MLTRFMKKPSANAEKLEDSILNMSAKIQYAKI
jgi:hypothetical protein